MAHQFTGLRILCRGHVFRYGEASITPVSVSHPFRQRRFRDAKVASHFSLCCALPH